MRVFVYYNLHKHCWSVRDQKTRKVIDHCDVICLRDVRFKVSEAGRQRVLKERRKNVHAGVEGIIDEDATSGIPPAMVSVSYNPYKWSSFVHLPDCTPVHTADRVVMSYRKVFALNPAPAST